MKTKIQAAQLATRSGTTVVIGQGSRPDILLELVGPEGESIGTWFSSTATNDL
jgi:glutamate 5-kinase